MPFAHGAYAYSCCFFYAHRPYLLLCLVFFFNDTATTEIYTLSLHDALPILPHRREGSRNGIHLRRKRWADERDQRHPDDRRAAGAADHLHGGTAQHAQGDRRPAEIGRAHV